MYSYTLIYWPKNICVVNICNYINSYHIYIYIIQVYNYTWTYLKHDWISIWSMYLLYLPMPFAKLKVMANPCKSRIHRHSFRENPLPHLYACASRVHQFWICTIRLNPIEGYFNYSPGVANRETNQSNTSENQGWPVASSGPCNKSPNHSGNDAYMLQGANHISQKITLSSSW